MPVLIDPSSGTSVLDLGSCTYKVNIKDLHQWSRKYLLLCTSNVCKLNVPNTIFQVQTINSYRNEVAIVCSFKKMQHQKLKPHFCYKLQNNIKVNSKILTAETSKLLNHKVFHVTFSINKNKSIITDILTLHIFNFMKEWHREIWHCPFTIS